MVAVTAMETELPDPNQEISYWTHPITQHIADGPWKYESSSGKPIPGTVTSWKIVANGLGWEFTLRQDVKFHNGDPLTAEDVKFSYERTQRINPRGWATIKPYYDRTEVNDKYRYTVYTKVPYAPFLIAGGGVYIVPKNYVEKVGDEAFSKNPITSGPFKWVKQVIGNFAEMEAYEGYWGRKASVKNLIIKLVPEEATRGAMVRTGEADIVEVFAGGILALKGDPNIRFYRNTESSLLELNMNDLVHKDIESPVHNLRVRQALSMAIDRPTIVDKLYFGFATPVVRGSLYATWGLGYDSTLEPVKYDVEGAKKLLREAGYPDGFKTKLWFRELHKTDMEAIAGMWAKIGVKAELIQLETATYLAKNRDKSLKGGFSIYEPPLPYDSIVPIIAYLRSDGLYAWLNDKEMDDLLYKQAVEMDFAKREQIMKQIFRKIHEEVLEIGLVAKDVLYAAGPRVKDFELRRGWAKIVNLETVTLKD